MWLFVELISCCVFLTPSSADVALSKKILVFVLINLGFLPAHILMLRVIWFVEINPQGMRFARIVGSRTFPWRQIERVKMDATQSTVRSIVFKNKTINIPRTYNYDQLSAVIAAAAGKPQPACHRDFSTSVLGALFPLTPANIIWLLAVAFSFGFGMQVEQVAWVRNLLVPFSVMLLIVGTIANLISHQNRARYVRLSQRGVRILTTFGEYELAWSEIDEVFANAAAGKLELKTKRGKFELGTELNDFVEIASAIEVNQARVNRGHFIGP
jgi:hypothetical protein